MTETRQYRGAIYRGIGAVDIVYLPYPACGDDEVIVRNLLTGVCGSDIAAYAHGGDANLIWQDHEFGHEAVSEVVEIGRDVRGLTLGDRVFVNQGKALRDPRRMATVGGFSEYIRIPRCEVGYSVLPIDNDLPLKTAVLVEPFVIGTRAALNLDPGPGKTGIVFGAGIIGIAAALMLTWYGCPKVMVVDVSERRLANARAFGLLTCNPCREDLPTVAMDAFGRQRTFLGERCNADLYVDAVGQPVVINQFQALAGREAMLTIVGIYHAPVAFDMIGLCYSNWQIKGCGSLPIETAVPDILAMMRSGRWDLSSLVSHQYPLESIADAIVMGGRAEDAQKVCIAF